MPQAFDPNNIFVRVLSTSLGSEGLASIRTAFKAVPVGTVDVLADAPLTEPDNYFPVGAVHIVSPKWCAVDCNSEPYATNTGMSRVSWYISRLPQNGQINPPPPIHFQTRFATGPNSEVITAQRWQANKFEDAQGFIYSVDGPLSEQVELWARVPIGLGPVFNNPVRVTILVVVDRMPGTGIPLPNGSFLKTGQFIVP